MNVLVPKVTKFIVIYIDFIRYVVAIIVIISYVFNSNQWTTVVFVHFKWLHLKTKKMD